MCLCLCVCVLFTRIVLYVHMYVHTYGSYCMYVVSLTPDQSISRDKTRTRTTQEDGGYVVDDLLFFFFENNVFYYVWMDGLPNGMDMDMNDSAVWSDRYLDCLPPLERPAGERKGKERRGIGYAGERERAKEIANYYYY